MIHCPMKFFGFLLPFGWQFRTQLKFTDSKVEVFLLLRKSRGTLESTFPNNCYPPKQENELVHKITEELVQFLQEKKWKRLPTEKDGFPKVEFENSPSGHHRERKNHKPVSKCNKNWGLNGTNTIPKNMAYVPGQTWESDNHLCASHPPVLVEHNLSGSEESYLHAKGFAVTGYALPFDQMASNFMEMHLHDCPGGGSIAPVQVLTRPQMKDADDSEAYTQEILAYLEDMDFAIEKAKNDYSYYGRVCIDPQEFSHVVEIYGYPPVFNTDDLLDAFIDFREEGLTIMRVDNTHALGLFSSESAALRALSIRHPLLKIRKLSKGINKSRAKAVSCAEFIQSMREGPRKDTAGPEGQSC